MCAEVHRIVRVSAHHDDHHGETLAAHGYGQRHHVAMPTNAVPSGLLLSSSSISVVVVALQLQLQL
jgi:hypothetical protein